jgi:ubiquinone/menaquinone biosynthesis C-methylase UbiE
VAQHPAASNKTSEEIARAYASPPWWYDLRGLFILTFAYRSTLGRQLRLFGANMGARHLEVAVGSGSLLDLILKWRRWKRWPAPDIDAFDYAEAMLAGAIRRFRHRSDVRLSLQDAARTTFDSATFDTVNIANAVHCLPEVDAALAEVFRLLKPGGTLAANVLLYPRGPAALRWIAERINRWGVRKGILFTPYEEGDILARLLAAGFVIEREAVSGNAYEVIARKPSPGVAGR